MSIEVRNISKKFGKFAALQDVNLDVNPGELLALLGPSGSGKTTLLRIIAGLEAADAGTILFDGEDTADHSLRDRRVGFVFQHYALFRHMTVFENVAFGLRVRPRSNRPSSVQIKEKVHTLLNLVQLDELAGRYPSQLSGGQRQRVALARALAVEPKVLLLDEPFGALDAKVRKDLRRWLRRLHDEIHVTSVFVTHDQEEALEVADRIVIMNEGRIEQIGTAEDVYNHPASPFVYAFLGDVNLFHGRVHEGQISIGPEGQATGDANGKNGQVFVRPHAFEVDNKPNDNTQFCATVTLVSSIGPMVKLELLSEWGAPIYITIPRERYQELGIQKGNMVYVSPREAKIFVDDYTI